MTRRDQVALGNLLEFYLDKQLEHNYFYFRFGQPRHLVALSFASLIHRSQKPILDLACGYGHVTRTLVQRAKGETVIGMDTSFFGLYVAKHWIAPEAEYVCCTADASLPFQSGTFSVAFCSDAFHYFANKATVFRELERLTQPDGLILLVWVHNALVRCPYDGLPLPPEGYAELMANIPHRIVRDAEVLARYGQRHGPPLAKSADVDRLSQAPLLSIVASHRQEVFRDHARFEDWPHAEGTLGVNPLYEIEARAGLGNVRLRRRFPSVLYEAEHPESKDYLPETVEVSRDLWANLREGKRGQEVERLIEQCVVTAMPPRYRCDD
jgi:SAM-dependent methyltransferase